MSDSKVGNTRGWSKERICSNIEERKSRLNWDAVQGKAREWWLTFEATNADRPALVLRLLEELISKEVGITEFFWAYVYSGTDNIQANLDFIEITKNRLGKERKLTPQDFESSCD